MKTIRIHLKKKKLGALVIAILLHACGGGGSTNEAVPITGDDTNPPQEPSLSCPQPAPTQKAVASIGRPSLTRQSVAYSLPLSPPPELWQPSSVELPVLSNYFYTEYTSESSGEIAAELLTAMDSRFDLAYYPFQLLFYAGNDESKSLNLWIGQDHAPIGQGYYPLSELPPPPFGTPVEWKGPNCDPDKGWVMIDHLEVQNEELQSVALRFKVQCEGTLYGAARWRLDDVSAPPGPSTPIPADLWSPPASFDPPGHNYIYLHSSPGDFVGQGGTYSYDATNSYLTVETQQIGFYDAQQLALRVEGDQHWSGQFETVTGRKKFEVGLYENASRYPQNHLKGSISWGGQGRGCEATDSSWFAIDHVAYDESQTLTALDMRFEQFCRYSEGSLLGQVHWRQSDTTTPPGPIDAPDNLWRLPATVELPTQNYIYIEGDENDFPTQGKSYLLTSNNAEFTVQKGPVGPLHLPSGIGFLAHGDLRLRVEVSPMAEIDRVIEGYYGNLAADGPGNPAKGGIAISVGASSCGEAKGWFVVDHVSYDNEDQITELDLRTEVQCYEAYDAKLRAQLHWRRNDNTAPAGPINPVPADVWQPAENLLDCTDNYFYLEDWQGGDQWKPYLQGKVRASLHHYQTEEYVIKDYWEVVIMSDDDPRATVIVQGPYNLSKLEAGFYSDMYRQNPTTGSISVSFNGSGCSQTTGWVAVDGIEYDESGELTMLDMRYYRQCLEFPLNIKRGRISWKQPLL